MRLQTAAVVDLFVIIWQGNVIFVMEFIATMCVCMFPCDLHLGQSSHVFLAGLFARVGQSPILMEYGQPLFVWLSRDRAYVRVYRLYG